MTRPSGRADGRLDVDETTDAHRVGRLLSATGVADVPDDGTRMFVASVGGLDVGAATLDLSGGVSTLARVTEVAPDVAARLVALLGTRPAYLSQASVLPAWQGRGIGRALLSHRAAVARAAGASALWATSWLHPGRGSLPGLTAAGLTVVGVVPGLWDVPGTPEPCPWHPQRCVCDAAVVAGPVP